PRPDGGAATGSARRADGRRQPGTRAPARRARVTTAHRDGDDVPLRRARSRHRHGGERPRDRHERRPSDRQRQSCGGARRRARRGRVSGNGASNVSRPLLEVADVEAGYGEALVLRGVSLMAFEAELVAIIGPNGAGKSTLLKVVYGLLRPTSGQVRYRTDDVTGVRPERLTRLGLNYVPQLGNVFPSLSIAENLLVGS